jgi:hypothetical protein
VCLEEDFTRAVRCSALRFQGGACTVGNFWEGGEGAVVGACMLPDAVLARHRAKILGRRARGGAVVGSAAVECKAGAATGFGSDGCFASDRWTIGVHNWAS